MHTHSLHLSNFGDDLFLQRVCAVKSKAEHHIGIQSGNWYMCSNFWRLKVTTIDPFHSSLPRRKFRRQVDLIGWCTSVLHSVSSHLPSVFFGTSFFNEGGGRTACNVCLCCQYWAPDQNVVIVVANLKRKDYIWGYILEKSFTIATVN